MVKKVYESLVFREEMVKVINLGNFFKIPADNRDLNYTNFFEKGKVIKSSINDFTSHNAKRLSVNETIDLLLKLPFIQDQINA